MPPNRISGKSQPGYKPATTDTTAPKPSKTSSKLAETSGLSRKSGPSRSEAPSKNISRATTPANQGTTLDYVMATSLSGLSMVGQKAPQKAPVRLSEYPDMGGMLKALDVDIEKNYKVPTSLKGYAKNKASIDSFNARLDKLQQLEPYKQPFNLTLRVGDLEGFGDISGGAKLARELRDKFNGIEEWRGSNIELQLDKISRLQADKPGSDELKSAIAVVKGVLGDTQLKTNIDKPLESPSNGLQSVEFSFPAHNASSDDMAFSVSQYGYDRLSPHADLHGSGPGHGALGVLALDRQQIESVVAQGLGGSPLTDTLKGQLSEHGVQSFHFGYFSKYDSQIKNFAKEAVTKSADKKVGIVLSRPAADIAKVASSLAGEGFRVRLLSVTQDGQARKLGDVAAQKKKDNGREVVLVELPQGVAQRDMLSLYYTSANPVGATGDQSFSEAYAMRNERNERSGKPNPGAADVLYDVVAQQLPLHRQLQELETHSIDPSKQGQAGLQRVAVHPDVVNAMQNKLLVNSVVLLANEALHQKASE